MSISGSDDELLEERDFLLDSLADLDAELAAGDIDQHDYLSLKDGYTARAAAVLRAIDPHRESAPVPVIAVGPAQPGSRWRVPAVIVGVGAVAIAAGLLVAGNSGQRLPGATATGAVSPTGPSAQLGQARADLGNGKYLDALKIYDGVIHQDPRNAEALAYRGWILRLTGVSAKDDALIAKGLASVQAAEAADPTYPDAHFFSGEILLRDRGDGTGAAAEFRAFLADNPPSAMVPEVQLELSSALAQASATTRP